METNTWKLVLFLFESTGSIAVKDSTHVRVPLAFHGVVEWGPAILDLLAGEVETTVAELETVLVAATKLAVGAFGENGNFISFCKPGKRTGPGFSDSPRLLAQILATRVAVRGHDMFQVAFQLVPVEERDAFVGMIDTTIHERNTKLIK